MAEIRVLDKLTIDKIAAGEVVERPLSVVKELVENAIDAGSDSITVEIKDGGCSMIRITDNGCGIPGDEIETAFLRHATSKIADANDLYSIHTLGFRGEALSSISSVSQMEVITKTADDLMGVRLVLEGGKKQSLSEVGAPDGTTMIVRNLFFNTPARKKFLKTPVTEGSYILSLLEHLAMSHPEIGFKFISNGQTKLLTAGNNQLKDVIYRIYGKDVCADLLPISLEEESIQIQGFIAKPGVSRGNRNFENFYVNGRYVKSKVISQALEEGFKSFIMQHKFPVAMLFFTVPTNEVDVNVHPTKMEVRFLKESLIFEQLSQRVKYVLSHQDLITQSAMADEKETEKERQKLLNTSQKPEPFEKKRLDSIRSFVNKTSPYEVKYQKDEVRIKSVLNSDSSKKETIPVVSDNKPVLPEKEEEHFLDIKSVEHHKIIGQVFDTYWLVEFHDSLFIIDQHAAHERILYEKTMKSLEEKEMLTQQVSPPWVVHLSDREMVLLKNFQAHFEKLGFVFEDFGGTDIMISGVPYNLFGLDNQQVFLSMIDELEEFSSNLTPQIVLEKVAMLSCKAAIKGNQRISHMEAKGIIDQLLALENPYHCPHGRPTIIEMKKTEMERKFHR